MMANTTNIIIDIIGIIISLFSVYVTYELFRKYRLRRTRIFIFTAINVLIWNICHILYSSIPADNYDAARVVYIIAQISGMLIIYGTVWVFSSLRNENIVINMVLYIAILTAFLTAVIIRDDFMNIVYDTTWGAWASATVSDTGSLVWNLYTLAILVMLVLELYLPLGRYYFIATGPSKKYTLYLILLAFVGPLANSLLPVLNSLELPPALRYIVANIGFLGVFWVFYKQPFVGIQDSVKITQILISNYAGVPVFTTASLESATLASGAIYGINAILGEITGQSETDAFKDEEEATRKIELSTQRFFMAKIKEYFIIYQYESHSGVCISKFTSLARTFLEGDDEDEQINRFKGLFVEYYPHYKDLMDTTKIHT
ncbi:MAG: hypothetical protein INQ03_16910 [Candidatus Heimdallarchaeota archaeon]|nr:hypothetical protein [Candidatus Heimdallarchaeota archaeon]